MLSFWYFFLVADVSLQRSGLGTTPSVQVPTLTPQRQQQTPSRVNISTSSQDPDQVWNMPQYLAIWNFLTILLLFQVLTYVQLANELTSSRIALQRLASERDNLAGELESHKRTAQDLKYVSVWWLIVYYGRALLVANQTAVAQIRAELARSQAQYSRGGMYYMNG